MNQTLASEATDDGGSATDDTLWGVNQMKDFDSKSLCIKACQNIICNT
jgi:hypothetical protein